MNRIPIFLSLSHEIELTMVEFTPTRTVKQLVNKLSQVIGLYRRAGFNIRVILMDREFESLKKDMPLVPINTTAAKEHVSEVERKMTQIKERACRIINTLPYKQLPHKMVIHFIYFVTLWLNAVPIKNGISEELSPWKSINR